MAEQPPDGGTTGKVNRGLETSHITRDGLEASTPAPLFRLPRLEGGEVALEDYRGRRVLLVFSDPECPPCDELAPHLVQLHRSRPDLRVLMISRREPELTWPKMAQFGMTFPIAFQKRWEISRLYGMFATPIGYLIDEQGVIAADVGVGADGVLALVPPATPGQDGTGSSR